MSLNLPTLEVLFAPSVVGSGAGNRFVLNISQLDTGTLGDGAFFYDISDYVRSFSINRGRRNDLERFATGTAQIVLSNLDRRFDPTNTASPYYNSTLGVSGVVPAIPIVVRATWNGTTYALFRGTIDSWNFAYSSGGAGDATATIQCSDAFKVLSNVIGGLPSSTTITSTSTTAFDTAVTVPTGTIGGASIEGGVTVVDTTSTTGTAIVVNNVEQTPIIGTSGDLSGTRTNLILDSISWPQNLRRVDTGRTRLVPQNASGTVLSMLDEVVQSETGALYVDADGTIVFDDRDSIVSESRSITSQATYDATSATGKKFVDVTVTYDDDLIYNVIRVNRKTTSTVSGDVLVGTTVIVSNPESISLYGARTYDLTLPIPSSYGGDSNYGNSESEGLALSLAAQYANPEFRPDSISFKPRRDPANLWPEALGRQLRDRVTVKFNVPGGGTALNAEAFISAINHSGSPDDWTTRFGLVSASFFSNFLILDNTSFGILDTNLLFY